ncbi:DUF3857 domain-containing protein [Flavobacterium adhaerens]|uniref:DUF3857 domain-containing protein n=1 Tax=Flavobacterium adhaerens TaxID=3149043 RepID=UPI0032B36EA8
MTLHRIISIVVLFFGIANSTAQEYKLGKVTVAELQQKVHPKDSSAVAAILFKKGRTYFSYKDKIGFSAIHECEIKIKIYKKEGLEWANQRVKFYVGYENINNDQLAFSDAVTYNLEKGSIVKTKLESQGTFKNKINKYWKEKAITLPNVKVGSIIEYKYELKSENIVKFPDFDFQYEIPVDYVYYKTELPEYYVYKPLLIGYVPLETNAKLTSGTQVFDNQYGQSTSFSYKQIVSTYLGKNIPALKEEPFVNNIENYRGSIKQELERIRFPDQPVKDYTMTWEGVASTIFKDEKFAKEFKDTQFLLSDISRLLANVESPTERMNKIFAYVQNRMNWNESLDYYPDKGVAKAYADQIGNVAEINFILINMLRLAGIEANPVLVSTIENGYPAYPTRTGFNYVIAAAAIDGKQILLDASQKFTSPNILPINVLNWKGRLIKSNGTSQEIDLEPENPSRENFNLLVKIDDGGKIDGQVRIQRTDYDAYRFRVENNTKSQEEYLEKLEEQLGDLSITKYRIQNQKTNINEAIMETFDFTSNGQLEIIGGKFFINPLLFLTRGKNPFNQEVRQMPVYFGYKNIERFNLNIQIPEGYAIESVPKSMKIISEDKQVVYSLNCLIDEDKIQIMSISEVNSSTFAPEDYGMLKDFFQKIIVSQNEKIVLKKI